VFFIALATDYDGTIAETGVVSAETMSALDAFKRTGRKLILVTGRELDDLRTVCPDLSIFDRVVAENGALLFDPANGEERVLSPAPPEPFVAALKARNVSPLSVGRSIVATWEPNEGIVLETIRDLGLDLQIVFNKGAVMVLPAGVNKATGLVAALKEMGLSPHNVVGVGDAENDHAFLRTCGCAVAVANALPIVKEGADVVTDGARGAGVIELTARIAKQDADIIAPDRHGIEIGTFEDGTVAFLQPHRGGVLIAGSSGIGKSTIATALTERMVERQFQFCVFDPEGDYLELADAVRLGDAKTVPAMEETVDLLHQIETNVVVCTLALDASERPAYFAQLLSKLGAFRNAFCRPHWLIVDEAHHVLPTERQGMEQVFPSDLPAAVLITVHPESVSPHALKTVETIIAVGDAAPEVIAAFCAAIDVPAPSDLPSPTDEQVVLWRRSATTPPRLIKVARPRQARKRHTRKYAEGELGPDRSFYFRGPEGALNLRAQNLMIFLQIAEGVDDATWMYHLRAGNYSKWFASMIKDNELAAEAAVAEQDEALSARQSRAAIADAVMRRYTVPARTRDA
jgi:hydroxymethylpyrimidine pyrophosphatase-like HAD family hydrolase